MKRLVCDPIAVVEAGYALDGMADRETWLQRVLSIATPQLAADRGVVACFYDVNVADPTAILSSMILHETDRELVDAICRFFEGNSSARGSVFATPLAVTRLSQIFGSSLHDHPTFGATARRLSIHDIVSVRAANLDGTGLFLTAGRGQPLRQLASWSARWSRIAAHLAAAMRLQRSITRLVADEADAVLSVDGRLLHATPAAALLREGLRRSARSVERARGKLRRSDPDASLCAWHALVEGRWSLVDSYESDGKRFLLALPNAQAAPDPRALEPDERTILQYVLLGHSNKLIAYELGAPEGTIARRVAHIARKLGVSSRVALIEHHRALSAAKPLTVSVGEAELAVVEVAPPPPFESASLTTAEREVVALVTRGKSDAAIALSRGTSRRTVSNILASVYRKLGVSSRAELAAHSSRQ